ncbi:MAG: DMT family transporter [Gammaproteobacteria bacterium]
MPSNHTPPVLPTLSLLFGATLWGVFWFPLRWLEAQGVPGLWSSLFIYLTVTVVSLPWLWQRRGELVKSPRMLLALALIAGWCNVAFILAVIEGNVVRVLLLFYLSPLWAALLGRLLLGERLSSHAWLTLAVAMTGALTMLWNAAAGWPWPQTQADWLAISAGFTFALSNVIVRKAQNISYGVKSIAVWWGGALMAGVGLLAMPLTMPEISLPVLGVIVALACGGMMVMTLAVQYGVTQMPVHRSAVILLFEIVAGAVSAQLLTDEIVLPSEWLGGALILAAAYFSARAARDTD